MVVFGKLFFLWLVLLLIDACCWSCLWRSVWRFLPQLLGRNFNQHMQFFIEWPFKKQFLHNFSFVAKSILSSTDLSLNWRQSFWRCFCLNKQQFIFSWFSICFPLWSSFSSNLLSLFIWFVCISYEFLMNWSLMCWFSCFLRPALKWFWPMDWKDLSLVSLTILQTKVD